MCRNDHFSFLNTVTKGTELSPADDNVSDSLRDSFPEVPPVNSQTRLMQTFVLFSFNPCKRVCILETLFKHPEGETNRKKREG